MERSPVAKKDRSLLNVLSCWFRYARYLHAYTLSLQTRRESVRYVFLQIMKNFICLKARFRLVLWLPIS